MGKGEDTKSLILDSALKIASVHGLDGLTIGTLATELQMSKSGLFAKFQSKENLQIDVLKSGIELFRRNVIYPSLKTKPGIERIITAVNSWLNWSTKAELPGGCIFLSSSLEYDDKPGIVRDFLVKSQLEWQQTLKKFFLEAVEKKEISQKADLNQIIQEIWGIILGFHFYNRLLKDPKAKVRAKSTLNEMITKIQI
ncbi:MAG: TetR/AcrR family transcriptional regulator [Leptospira sp.]|nr:TetR/AcrR family transcriptional regulator [Leptospira sp.]